MSRARLNYTSNLISTEIPIKSNICKCGGLDSDYLQQKLHQILITLQTQIENKNAEIERIRQSHKQELQIKDQVIERLVRANDKLSEDNLELKDQIERQKQIRYGELTIKLKEMDRSKSNISQMMTFDNSYRNAAEKGREVSRSKQKLVGKISKNWRDYNQYKNTKSTKNYNNDVGQLQVKYHKPTLSQNLTKVRSSAFIDKKNYGYLNMVSQNRLTLQRTNAQNEQSVYRPMYKNITHTRSMKRLDNNNSISLFRQVY